MGARPRPPHAAGLASLSKCSRILQRSLNAGDEHEDLESREGLTPDAAARRSGPRGCSCSHNSLLPMPGRGHGSMGLARGPGPWAWPGPHARLAHWPRRGPRPGRAQAVPCPCPGVSGPLTPRPTLADALHLAGAMKSGKKKREKKETLKVCQWRGTWNCCALHLHIEAELTRKVYHAARPEYM